MIHRRLEEELNRARWRYRWLRLFQALSIGWLAVAAVGLGVFGAAWRGGPAWPWMPSALAAACTAAACAGVWLAFRAACDPRQLARRIEASYPDLNSLLLTAVEQEPESPTSPRRWGYLQETVIRDAVAHGRQNDWRLAVSPARLRRMQLAALSALGLVVAVTAALVGQAKGRAQTPLASGTPPLGETSRAYQIKVSPGDTKIERGTSLIVTARFDALVPDDAVLVCCDSSGESTRTPMSLSLSDPMFGGRVASVQSDLVYRVEYAGQSTRDFHVTVFEYPQLRRADVRLDFPQYTHLEPKVIEDTRRATAVEGTRLTLTCRLNKPVDDARLVPEKGEPIELVCQARREAGGDPAVWTVARTLSESARYRLHLVDAAGRANKEPPEFVFHVVPNRAPDVKVTFPGRDVRVSPIEELATGGSVWDDFGLSAYGIHLILAGQPAQEVVLGRSTERNDRSKLNYLIDFEALHAEPDQLLSYYLWAEDVGPDGSPRRTLGDMYFAEVRHFEEIFREGQPPPANSEQQQQGQGENARQAEQLAEQQKQIINATWKVIRRETGSKPTETFAADVGEIRQSQQDALDKLGSLDEKLRDAESQQHAAAVAASMQEALGHLAEAAASTAPAPLTPALAAEQAAYQGLLKLRAREHEVVRSRQQRGQRSASASGPQSRARQQLEQLELKQSENRYETERQPDAQRDRQEQENRQVYNRLRELARRQGDLNQRMKELQSALEEAKTEKEREEIAEQLRRLRQQQREMLRDTDELAERMAAGENQERMADSRQQLDQTRENVRQASEALNEGQLSQAVTSGTRAERRLSQMREEFRQRTSSRFSDEVKQLRETARKLDENESRLGQRLEDLGQKESPSNSLRDLDRPQQLGDEFRRQQEDVGRLLEDVRQTVEKAEEAEPVMTRHLYDSFRRARQQNVEDTLKATGDLVDRGIVDQAKDAEAQAAGGIKDLKQGIEKAARSVLGDEDEALRTALRTLDDLARELNEEINQADPRAARNRSGQPPTESQTTPDSARQGDTARPAQRPSREPRASDQPSLRPPQEDRQARGGRPTGEPQQAQPSPQPDAQNQASQRPGGQRPPSQQQGRNQTAQRPGGQRDSAGQQSLERFLRATSPRGDARGPITGDDFVQWSDRLRDVEEMVDDTDMRARAAQIRDAARGIRLQARGGSQGPKWDMVRQRVAAPLAELRDLVAEELMRRSAKPSVPIDRDPVPSKYAEQVRRYYEELGGGR